MFKRKTAVATVPPRGVTSPAHPPPRVKACCAGAAGAARRFLPALAVVLAVAAVLYLAVVLAALAGLWSWEEMFPHKGPLFDPVKDCRAVHAGPETPCSNIWESTCFDRSRCLGAGGGGSLSVYVHDETCSMRSSSEIVAEFLDENVPKVWSSQPAGAFRQAAKSRGLLAETPEQACIIVSVLPYKEHCVSETPTWEEGKNHLLVDFHDESRAEYPELDAKAMFAESNMRPCYFRYGYDIAIPLLAKSTFNHLRGIAPQDRKYFATFKGSLYLSGNGFLEWTAVRSLGDAVVNGSRVVVVELCQTKFKEHLLSRNAELCEGLQREYNKTDYGDLMNTTFALVPEGRSPATYRLGEALSAGAIPVFIHQNFVKPFPRKIPWGTFSFSFPAEEVPRIIDTLKAVPAEKLAEMQVTAVDVFDRYFGSGTDGIARTTLDILEERLSFRARRR